MDEALEKPIGHVPTHTTGDVVDAVYTPAREFLEQVEHQVPVRHPQNMGLYMPVVAAWPPKVKRCAATRDISSSSTLSHWARSGTSRPHNSSTAMA